MRGHVCGGTPSEHDRKVLADFAAALALPTEEEQRAALYAMSYEEPTR